MDYYEEFKQYQINKNEKRKLYWRWKLLGCIESKTKLIMSFMPMSLKLATKFSQKVKSIEPNDYLQESYIIISEAIDRYDDDRAELSTFIYHSLRWHFKKYTQKTLSPVIHTQKSAQVLKRYGVSLNAVYWSDIEHCYRDNRDYHDYYNGDHCECYQNRSDTILDEEE